MSDTDMSKPSDVARAIGRLEAGAEATHDRIDELKDQTNKRFSEIGTHLHQQDVKLDTIMQGISRARGGIGMLVTLAAGFTGAVELIRSIVEYFRGLK
jgi:hypothetical protein